MNQPTTKLIASLAGEHVAVLVEKPENRRYLSGFTGSAGTLLVGQSGAFLITDGRYAEQARDQASGWSVVVERNAVQAVAMLVSEHHIKEILFDAKSVTYDVHAALQAAVGNDVELTPTYDLIENLRQRKTPDELESIDKAFAITNEAFDYIFGELREGMSEKEVAWMLERFMREAGAEKIKENHVIASGPRSALPHGRATARIIEKGDFLTMDIGAVVNGYYADMTRTVIFGQPSDRQREVYDLVLQAQHMALEMMRPGLVCGHADTLGHALGLEIHERPTLRGGDETVLQEGHVITVEPGLYFPGWGGVRIEDPVVITSTGYRNLATVTKELIVI